MLVKLRTCDDAAADLCQPDLPLVEGAPRAPQAPQGPDLGVRARGHHLPVDGAVEGDEEDQGDHSVHHQVGIDQVEPGLQGGFGILIKVV